MSAGVGPTIRYVATNPIALNYSEIDSKPSIPGELSGGSEAGRTQQAEGHRLKKRMGVANFTAPDFEAQGRTRDY
jgi:hypothetical protein